MTVKIIYLISVLIGYVPSMIENTIYQIKYLKEGYYYTGNRSFIKDLLKPVGVGILALIPGLNIIRGFKSMKKIVNIKSSYADYKLDQIINDDIHKKDAESDEEKIEELFLTVADALGKDEAEKNDYKKASEILSLLMFLEEHDFELDEQFDKLTTDEKINYLKNIKSEILKNNSEIIENEEEGMSLGRRKK